MVRYVRDNFYRPLSTKLASDSLILDVETAHPGYLGSQDTFYVGNLKGVVDTKKADIVKSCSLANRINASFARPAS